MWPSDARRFSSATACCSMTAAAKAAAAAAIGPTRARRSSSPPSAASGRGPTPRKCFIWTRTNCRRADSGSRLWGANYELSAGGLDVRRDLHEGDAPTRRSCRNATGSTSSTCAPTPRRCRRLPDLSFEIEYAREANGDALASNAWTLQAAYELSDVAWTPSLSYRYAFFEGDDPAIGRERSV